MSKSFKQFLLVFFPWSIAFLVFFTYFYLSETEKINSIRQESELLNVRLGKQAISRELQTVMSDLLILAEHHAFHSDRQHLSSAAQEHLAEDLLVFTKRKGLYDQIRFLDTSGAETVRINYSKDEAGVVPVESLQNKGERYYFKESLGMIKNRVFISPLDLNVEHGKIEKPHKPTIRFGTPVFNARGEKIGVVLLNYLAERLLGNFTSAVANIEDHAWIVNAQGYWLRHPQPEMEWGFMLDHKQNLSKIHPGEWKQMLLQGSGQFHNDNGLFTFSTVQVYQVAQPEHVGSITGLGSSLAKEYQWKIISHVSRETLEADKHRMLFTLLKIVMPALLLLTLISWFLSLARTKSKEAEEELNLAATVFEAAGEGIIVSNAENVIQTVNPAFTRITGYAKEEVVDKTPAVLSSGRHDVEFYKKMKSSLFTSHRWEGEIWNRRKNGETYPQWLSIVALVDAKDNISNFVALFNDITTKKESEEALRRQATIDALTGLPNRQLFLDRLSRAILHSKRLETRFSLLFIDLDKFKAVNDTLGHMAGDELLQEVSRRIRGVVRESDTVARLGGDEFTVILNNISSNDDAARISQIIINVLSEPFQLNGQEANIGASIGISLYPEDGVEQTSLINSADSAMYDAKQSGRNRFCFFASAAESKHSTS